MSNNPTVFKALPAWLRRWLPAGDCLLCGASGDGAALCPACADTLPRLAQPACPVCALPVPLPGPCGACLGTPPHFDATLAHWVYDFPLDTLVHSLKFGHRLPIADFFAQALLTGEIPAGDLLLPVPLSDTRLEERGFNQSLEIARLLGRALGRPVSTRDCVRSLHTTPQSALPWKARRKNMRHAFDCRRDLTGLHVIVIDDVMTTGATLDELARTLKNHGAAKVSNWVVARTVRHD